MGFGAVAGIIVAGLLGLTIAYYAAPDQVNALFGNETTEIPRLPEISGPVTVTNDKPQTLIFQTQGSFDTDKAALLMHKFVNEARQAEGLQPLSWDSDLAKIAELHSIDMAQNGFFDHINLKGQDPTDRAREYGYSCFGIAENIHERPVVNDEEQAVKSSFNAFMNSEGHKANILENRAQKEGIGIALSNDGYLLVTENFC